MYINPFNMIIKNQLVTAQIVQSIKNGLLKINSLRLHVKRAEMHISQKIEEEHTIYGMARLISPPKLWSNKPGPINQHRNQPDQQQSSKSDFFNIMGLRTC